jgi:hypothetical protein
LVRPEEVGMGVGEGRPVGGFVLVGREGQSRAGEGGLARGRSFVVEKRLGGLVSGLVVS